MSERVAVDTSVAVPLLVRTHPSNTAVIAWAHGKDLALSGHALVETYSVLTRLPDGLRVSPGDAALLLQQGFSSPLVLSPRTTARLPATFAALGIAGGAVYDAMVGLAAAAAEVPLVTRDARAVPTYQAAGAVVHVLD